MGALAGDIIGSIYEFKNIKTKEFPLFTGYSIYTDDSIMTLAVSNKLLKNSTYVYETQYFGGPYANTSYDINFRNWLFSDNPKPYNSYGNGTAMRVSPMAFAFDSIEDVLEEAKRSAEITHNHPEGIKGAQAVASAIFLARIGSTKDEIRKYIVDNFNYDLNRNTKEIKPIYLFDETCQGSVPEAIICFLESNEFEDAIRLAVSIGGDSDTIACITGSIAEAFYKGVPNNIKKEVLKCLPDVLLAVLINFPDRFNM